MAVLTLNRKEVEAKIGKITPEIEEKISMFGTTIDKLTDDEISIEIYPNRPDLLSFEGFVRAISIFLGKKKPINYKIKKSNAKITVDKSVAKIRPYSMAAIVKKIKFTDEKIKEIMQWQEKIHSTIGRNRKKVAMGYYILDKIKFPVRYTADEPKKINFIPLEMPEKMNAIQILSRHPCGRDYGNLLKEYEKFPVYYDSNGEVLSLPPIINSDIFGKIIPRISEVLVECSGSDLETLKKVITIAVVDLIDCGGEAYAVNVIYKDKKETIELEPEKIPFSIDFVNKTLGLDLKEKEIRKLLKKMGIELKKEKDNIMALIPPYRADIMHEVDIAEEVAIAYGYGKFIPEIPKISTIGGEDKISIFKKKISEILIGLGLLEISSYHLSTKEKQLKKIGIKGLNDKIIEVLDAKTENNILRNSLFAQAISILSENIDASYPQKIFEIGKVFSDDNAYELSETQIVEKENLCIALCHEKANFTEIKQVFDYLCRMLDKNYEIRENERPSFIRGRCGEIIIDGKAIGIIGEISPNVLYINKIKMPVALLEIEIEKLM